MDLDQSFLNTPEDLGMRLPPGVVANAPYQGASPMLPHIPVPLATPFYMGTQTRNQAGPDITPGDMNPLMPLQQRRWPPRQPDTTESSTSSTTTHCMPSSSAAATYGAIRPTMLNALVLGLSAAQLHRITGGHEVKEHQDHGFLWTYEMRREAQSVLPFLYLGPSTAARDRTFLRRTGITKVIAIRDSRLALARLLVVEHVAKEMGIESECIDVSGLGGLLRALPAAVQSINQHMLAAPTDSNGISTGKVLVFCETGNVRSPPVVAAYMMSMYGMDLVDTLRFLCKMRFCVSLDEECKHMLLSFSDLLHARRDVAEQTSMDDVDDLMQDDNNNEANCYSVRESVERTGVSVSADFGGYDAISSARAATTTQSNGDRMDTRANHLAVPNASSAGGSRRNRPPKRHVEETMDEEDDRIEGASEYAPSREPSAEPGRLNLDMARYQDRTTFVPFTDTGSAP